MDCDEPHLAPNEKMQPIQWTERPTGALVAAGSLCPMQGEVSHGTVTGFLLGRVRARRVPFLVFARSCSGECREKNNRERQQPWGKRNRWRSRWMFSLRMAFEAAEAN